MVEPALKFDLLGEKHRDLRSQFDCGKSQLDAYLARHAKQDMERGVATVHVLYDETAKRIAGYFPLSSATVRTEDLPNDLARKLPKYPEVGATLIGRLAADRAYQGRGIGGRLLRRALELVLDLSQVSASYAVVVDALDDEAIAFYERYDFRRLAGHERRLYLPTATIRKAVEAAK